MPTESPKYDFPGKADWFREYNEDYHSDPYPFYRKLLREEPMVYVEERSMWIASGYDDVSFILKDPKFVRELRNAVPDHQPSATPPEWKPISDLASHWMLFRDPPVHTRLRGLVSHAFTPRTMERLRPRIRSIAGDLAKDMPNEQNPDLLAGFAFPLPVIVIAEMLGVPAEDREIFKEWSNTIARLLDIALLPPDFVQHAGQVALAMREYFQDLIAERKRRPREDMISDLLSAREQGDHLSEEELISTCVLLLVAGHETTVNLISNGMYLLLQHPEQHRRLQQHPEHMRTAIEEVLRYESPVQMTSRIAAADLELGGMQIRQGQQVSVLLAAANRDPSQFAEPDQFDVMRLPNRHLAFASGPHFCLGAPLARMEGEIALSVLLESYPHMQLTGQKPKWRPNILFRGLQSLNVKI
ncbi:cytochrome P450 [Paenibacillus tarimensis]